MGNSGPGPVERAVVAAPGLGRLGPVVRIRPFRRLWLVLGLSSLGDWLGLLGIALFASAQVSGAAQGIAFGSVIAVRLVPALVLGTVAGIVADRFDRRRTMAITDVFRFVVFASIPTVGVVVSDPALVVAWATVATFLIESAGMLWIPAKEAAVPNLVPRDRLETANQLLMITTFGITPVLAALLLAAITRLPHGGAGFGPVDAALYFNALTFLAAAAVVWFGVTEISGRRAERPAAPRGPLRDVLEAGRYIAGTPLLRGLVVGMLGAFAAGGVVVGSARFYAESLGGGDATFAVLFGAVFVGLGAGVVAVPRLVGQLPRRRSFCLSIMLAGLAVAVLAFAPHLAFAVLATLLVGLGTGMGFLSGITLVGAEVSDRLRGRVFAFGQTAVRITLLLTISASALLVGVGGTWHLRMGALTWDLPSSRVLLLAAGVGAALVGWAALRQMDDRRGVPLLRDLWDAIRDRPISR